MAQIEAMSVYVPYHRLKGEEVAGAWHAGAPPGERAVAGLDEDSLTMGVEAALGLVDPSEAESVDALYFATTTPPYRVKQAAAQIAYVVGMREDSFTADFGDSFRAGTTALIAAMDAVNSGRARRALVIASDCRTALPGSAEETASGDAACALLVGPGTGGLDIVSVCSAGSALVDRWQRSADRFMQGWEDRFAKIEGYQRDLARTVSELLSGEDLSADDVARFVFSAPDPRSPAGLAKALRFDPRQKLADTLFTTIGYSGAAGALVSLCAALPTLKTGDRVVLANHGDGCDALLLAAGGGIADVCRGRTPEDQAAGGRHLSYVDYLRFKKVLDSRLSDIPEGPSSAPQIWREKKALWRLVAHRCRKCGTMHYPMERVCYQCFSKDDFDEVPLAREGGNVFTYTTDYLFQSEDPPQVMAVVEARDGCRLYLQMTDQDPDEIKVGLPVRFTFRRLHEGAGFHNYFWKCRPDRAAKTGGR